MARTLDAAVAPSHARLVGRRLDRSAPDPHRAPLGTRAGAPPIANAREAES